MSSLLAEGMSRMSSEVSDSLRLIASAVSYLQGMIGRVGAREDGKGTLQPLDRERGLVPVEAHAASSFARAHHAVSE